MNMFRLLSAKQTLICHSKKGGSEPLKINVFKVNYCENLLLYRYSIFTYSFVHIHICCPLTKDNGHHSTTANHLADR